MRIKVVRCDGDDQSKDFGRAGLGVAMANDCSAIKRDVNIDNGGLHCLLRVSVPRFLSFSRKSKTPKHLLFYFLDSYSTRYKHGIRRLFLVSTDW